MARLKLREGWMTLLLLAATLLTVSGAIQRADWTDDLGLLTPITLLTLVVGVLLAKWRRLPWPVAHLLATVIGVIFVVNRLEPILPLAPDQQNFTGSLQFLLERGRVWLSNTGTDRYADDFYLFLLGISMLMWFVGYAAAWMIFRSGWIWPAILLPATVLLVNLGYAPANVSSSLILFLISGLLLVARFHIGERENSWQQSGIAFPESLAWRALWIGVVVVLLTIGIGWGAPVRVSGDLLDAVWSRINGPWTQLETTFNRRFGSLRGGVGARSIGNFATFGDRFRLGGPLKLSETPVLLLRADRGYYLKVHTYDTFDGHQWSSNVDETFVHSSDGRQYVPQVSLPTGQGLAVPTLKNLEQRELTVQMLANKNNGLFIADQFISANQPTYVVMSWTQYRNQIFDLETTKVEDLPPDLRNVFSLLTTASCPLRNTDDQGNILPVRGPNPSASPAGSRPPGTRAIGTTTPVPTATPYIPTPAPCEQKIEDERKALQVRLVNVRQVVKNGVATKMIVDGQLPNYGDVEVVTPQSPVVKGNSYTLSVNASTALAPDLRDAGGNYPDWVVRRYLQLPATTTDQTRQLAKQLENGQDPYDAAISIQNWLRENVAYNEQIPFPPEDRDVIDYLLFTSRQGYCEYYSTAMVIMLRSLGIPAREVVGFFSANYDDTQSGFLYRESNAHAWVEAYFPGYGWIAFEPTAPRVPFDREPAPPPGEDPGGSGGGAGGAVGTGNGLLPEDELPTGGIFTTGTIQRGPSHFWQVTRIAVPTLVLVTALLAALWFLALRGLSPGGQFYARMTHSSRLVGVKPAPGTTPYEWARAVGDRVPDARRSLDQITNLYVREQYAGRPPNLQELRLVRRAWLSFRTALLRSVVSFRRHRPTEAESGD